MEQSRVTQASVPQPRTTTHSRLVAAHQPEHSDLPHAPQLRTASHARVGSQQESGAKPQRPYSQRTTITTSSPSTRTTVPGRRSPAAAAAAQAAADKEIEALGQQIVELLDRVRQSEERTAYAEQQLVHMTHMANAAAAAAEALPARNAELDFSMPKPAPRAWLPWTIVGGLSALVAAGFLLGYSPLRSDYEAAIKQNEELIARHSQELDSVKMNFSDERQRLESQLAAAQSAAAAAAAAAAPAEQPKRESGSSYSRSSASDDDSSDSEERSARAEERAEARAAKAAERKAAYEERKAARLAKREERRAAAEERKAERAAKAEERRAKRGSSSEDEEEPLPPPKKSNINPWATSAPSGGGSDDPLEGL